MEFCFGRTPFSACQKSTIYTKNGIAHCRGGNLPPGHFVYKMASPTAIIIYFLRKSQQLLRNYWAGGRLPPLRLLSKISGFLTVSQKRRAFPARLFCIAKFNQKQIQNNGEWHNPPAMAGTWQTAPSPAPGKFLPGSPEQPRCPVRTACLPAAPGQTVGLLPAG